MGLDTNYDSILFIIFYTLTLGFVLIFYNQNSQENHEADTENYIEKTESRKLFNKITSKTYLIQKPGAPQCSICLEDFRLLEEYITLPDCLHCFHSSCVSKWFDERLNCPNCRSDLSHHVHKTEETSDIISSKSLASWDFFCLNLSQRFKSY